MNVRVGDQIVEAAPGQSAGEVLSKALSGKAFKNTVAARVGDALVDLSTALTPETTEISPVPADSPEGVDIVRHSAAHIMAEAVKKLFPTAQVTIGPAIENGFYYDFAFERPFTSDEDRKSTRLNSSH